VTNNVRLIASFLCSLYMTLVRITEWLVISPELATDHSSVTLLNSLKVFILDTDREALCARVHFYRAAYNADAV